MNTVKDVSEISGVSIRTLRYYDEIQKILDHTLGCMSEKLLKQQIQKYESVEKYREHLATGFSNEQAITDVFKWYGSKEKAMEAIMQSTGDVKKLKQEQDKNAEIYKKFMTAKETNDANAEKEAVEKLAENYKEMFKLDNARSILLDLANEYLEKQKLAKATDSQFGNGCPE